MCDAAHVVTVSGGGGGGDGGGSNAVQSGKAAKMVRVVQGQQ